MWDALLDTGLILPVAPLWSVAQQGRIPRQYREWIEYDLALIERVADAVLALDAHHTWRDGSRYRETVSSGRDREINHATALGLPVFFQFAPLCDWAAERCGRTGKNTIHRLPELYR